MKTLYEYLSVGVLLYINDILCVIWWDFSSSAQIVNNTDPIRVLIFD